jgi:hypothetical protein
MMNLNKYVLENWKLKLLSVVLATMLWFVVFLIGETKKEISVPVSITNLSKDYVIVKIDIPKIDIALKGRVSVLKDVKEGDVRASLNASDVREGENILNMAKNNIQIPRGVQIADIRPSSIKMDVDRIIEKKVKVSARLDRRWMGEYEVKSVLPDYVTITGPKRILEQKTSIETLPANGELKHSEETVVVSFNVEGLQASTIKPESVKVILRRHSGKKIIRD